ncbi:MAG: hypothetical protein ACRDVP_00510, partial [Acidimicrobiales bacterium]
MAAAVLGRGLAVCALAGAWSFIAATTTGAASTTAALMSPAPQAHSQRGGSATVLLRSGVTGSWENLDPIEDPDVALNSGILNAIFGTLFAQNAK